MFPWEGRFGVTQDGEEDEAKVEVPPLDIKDKCIHFKSSPR